MAVEDTFNYQKIDDLLHSRIRLAVVSLLASCEEAEFTWIREKIGATDGNLASHCRKLEEAGYISMRKTFMNRKPVTWYRLTDTGRKAFKEYLQQLSKLLKISFPDQPLGQ